MKVKVCGMREMNNLRQLSELAVDYVGFIFYAESKRFVSDGLMDQLFSIPPVRIKKVGVFVHEAFDVILDKIRRYHLEVVQLHGKESVSQCLALKEEGVMVIKAFGVNEYIDFLMLKPYLNAVDYFLFDTQSPSYGGTGRAFDWNILRKYPYDKPYFLSGGLGLENLKQLKELSDDRLFALDLNSKFETESGIKDVKGVAEAIKIIRSIEREEQS